MSSLKNISKLLTGIGALMVTVHTAGVLFVFCSGSMQCAASVNFGLPEYNEPPLLMDIGVTYDTTLQTTTSEGVLLSDVHALVQTVGLYLLLIGVVLLLILELKELRLLKHRRA